VLTLLLALRTTGSTELSNWKDTSDPSILVPVVDLITALAVVSSPIISTGIFGLISL